MNRKVIFLVIALIAIISVSVALRSCHDNSSSLNSRHILDMEKQGGDYLMSSDAYFIGRWKLTYADMVNYKYDDSGKPKFDVFKQPDVYSFDLINENLVIEDTFPVISSEHSGKDFKLNVDVKILDLVISGKVVDNDVWEGVFEYISESQELVGKCNVTARRMK